MPAAQPGHVFRPRSSSAVAIGWGLVTVGWAWLALHDGGVAALVRQAPAIVLAATLVYGVLVRPSVEVSGSGVTLRNVVRDVEVPWAALTEVRTRYAFTLVTTDGRSFTAWAAPASGRHTDASLTSGEVAALGWPGAGGELPPTSASTASSSGAVAVWVRREWARAMDSSGGSSGSVEVHTQFSVGLIVTLALASALGLLTALT